MDYRATLNEADDPAGASPWGSSPHTSPPYDTPGFGESPSVVSPFPFAPQPSNGTEPTGEDEVFPNLPGAKKSDMDRDTYPANSEVDASIKTQQPDGLQQHDRADLSAGPSEPSPHVAQVQSPAAQRQQGQARAQRAKPSQPQPKLLAKITGLERTGKKDPVLRFDIHYRDVRRLHSEFVKLGQHLISANPDALVPAVPPPVTAAGAGTDEDEARVKAMLQRWFSYVCSNEILMKDDEMVLFVESDFGYSPVVKMKQPATGVRRKILKQFAPPPDDTPELASARPAVKLFYLGTMDGSHKVDKMVKARRGLGLAESDYGVKMGSMNVQEPHPGLANAFRKLGRVIQTVGDYHAAQATAEATTIGDPLQYHSQDAFIVKESLTNRQILIREFLQAQEITRSKLNAADRLKASSSVRREKVDEAIAALDEARQSETMLFNKTTRVTQNLVQEHRKWFSRTATELRASIRDFVLREIEAERRTLAVLETVRPDVRSIDASGGLSRLGREAHPTIRRTSLAASQGPKGDAWSGVPRRSDATSRSVSGSFMGKLPEEDDEDEAQSSKTGKLGTSVFGGLGDMNEDDEDRIDARNAASRLATSTF